MPIDMITTESIEREVDEAASIGRNIAKQVCRIVRHWDSRRRTKFAVSWAQAFAGNVQRRPRFPNRQ
jgi:hypothetical protein